MELAESAAKLCTSPDIVFQQTLHKLFVIAQLLLAWEPAIAVPSIYIGKLYVPASKLGI